MQVKPTSLLGPVPVPTPDDREYWEGCARDELILQRCAECKAYRHLPRPMCPKCRSTRGEWVRSAGMGTIHSYTIVHNLVGTDLGDVVPYDIGLVEMDEGPRIISNMVDMLPDEVGIGMRVRVTFREVAPGVKLPKFEKA